jgi:hypothetical protein
MRIRFAAMVIFATISVFLFSRPFVPRSSLSSFFVAGVPFLLSRPLPNRRLLFRRMALDERELIYLRRIDSTAITVYFSLFFGWLLVGTILATVFSIVPSTLPLPIRMVTTALQTLPGFVLVHSVVGLVLFGRDERT